MSAAKLEKPAIEHKESCIEALKEFHKEGLYEFLKISDVENDFEAILEKLNNGKKELHREYPDWVEYVPESVYWLVKEHEYIGTLNIRHRLNWHLEKWGGHVHFVIRPSMRGKGFGKKLMQKAIPYIAYNGIDTALMTVAPENKAAIRILEFCGAELEGTHAATDRFPACRRYWLDCT